MAKAKTTAARAATAAQAAYTPTAAQVQAGNNVAGTLQYAPTARITIVGSKGYNPHRAGTTRAQAYAHVLTCPTVGAYTATWPSKRKYLGRWVAMGLITIA